MSNEQSFEVEKILGCRKVHEKTEYLIRWKGFGPEEDSWEPRSNLVGCQELLKAFKMTLEANKSQSPQFTRVKTPRKQGGTVIKEEKEDYRILHRKTQPELHTPIDEKSSPQVASGCPVLQRNAFGFLLVLSMIVVVIIVFGSQIPGVET